MIEDFFETDNPATQADLRRIDKLVCSDVFLKGLGDRANDFPPPAGFPVVRDTVRARELLLPSALYELPEPWPYQEFFGVIEDEYCRIQYKTGMPEYEIDQIHCIMDRKSIKFGTAFDVHSGRVVAEEKIIEKLRAAGSRKDLPEAVFKEFSEVFLPHNVREHVYYIIMAAYFGGIDNSPLFKRMFEAFQSGGFPCGWLGPLPEDGGDPGTAVALLHFG
jgi:hypothetical protein